MMLATFLVNMDDESPCGTALLYSIASSMVLNLSTYRIGQNSSVLIISALGS